MSAEGQFRASENVAAAIWLRAASAHADDGVLGGHSSDATSPGSDATQSGADDNDEEDIHYLPKGNLYGAQDTSAPEGALHR